jgi:hypothetical protein
MYKTGDTGTYTKLHLHSLVLLDSHLHLYSYVFFIFRQVLNQMGVPTIPYSLPL